MILHMTEAEARAFLASVAFGSALHPTNAQRAAAARVYLALQRGVDALDAPPKKERK